LIDSSGDSVAGHGAIDLVRAAARGAASSEAARNVPGYLLELLLFVVFLPPLLLPFLAPFFFAGIVSALRKRLLVVAAVNRATTRRAR
jgi:hypothetical protein